MNVTLTNTTAEPVYVRFANEADLNLNPGGQITLLLMADSSLVREGNKIVAKSIK